MFDRFTNEAKQTMARSRLEALRLHHEYIDTAHLLLGLLRQPSAEVAQLLAAVDVEPAALLAAVEAVVKPGRARDMTTESLPFTPGSKRVLERSMEIAAGLLHTSLGVGHLLVAIAAVAKPPIATALAEAGIAFEPLERAFAARSGGDYTTEPRETNERRVAQYSQPQAMRNLQGMAQILDDFTAAAVEAQQFDAAAVLRELRQRVLLAMRELPA